MRCWLGGALVVLLAATAQGDNPTIVDGDFETPVIGPPFISYAPVPGWTRHGSPGKGNLVRVGYFDSNGTALVAGHGKQFLLIGAGNVAVGDASWTTDITGLTPGVIYLLRFLSAPENPGLTEEVTVGFTRGSSTASQTFTVGPSSGALGAHWLTWEQKQMTFLATEPVATLMFSVFSQKLDLGLDDVTVDVAVPELQAVVNSATFAAGSLAPNTFVSLFGTNFSDQDSPSNIFPATSFQGISVLVNGVPAPLFFVGGKSGQINIVLPSELPESGTANIQVADATGASAAFPVPLAPHSVGIFRIPDPSNPYRVNGAVLFANTAWKVMPVSMATALGLPDCELAKPATVCGQPAKVGDAVQIYATGLGKATPNGDPNGALLPAGMLAPADGSVLYNTVDLPLVTIDGIPATVSFSGIAPGNSGEYQINVTIPQGVQPGDNVLLNVTMPDGNSDSVTIAVRAN